MAIIRCMDVTDSAQFVVERSFAIVAEGASSLRCSSRCGTPCHGTLLGKAAVKEPWTPNAALTTKRSMRFGSSTREWPGVSFFRAAQKGVVCYAYEGECYVRRRTMRVWLICWRMWRVDRRPKDGSLCSLSLYGSEGRSSKVLVADASSAPVRSSAAIRTVGADRRGSGWSMVAQREHSFCSVMLCETQFFRGWRFCWQGQCHHCLGHRG